MSKPNKTTQGPPSADLCKGRLFRVSLTHSAGTLTKTGTSWGESKPQSAAGRGSLHCQLYRWDHHSARGGEQHLGTAGTSRSSASREAWLCHTASGNWILPATWRGLEADSPSRDPPAENTAQPTPAFQLCETLSKKTSYSVSGLLTYRTIR